MPEALRLTDDEVVAVLVQTGAEWSTVLPTVDRSSRDDLARAGERGMRSLVVRSLVSTEHAEVVPSSAVREAVAAASRPILVAWDAGADDPYQPSGMTVSTFRWDDDDTHRLVVVSIPAGIHDLSVVTRAEASRVTTNFIGAVVESSTATVVRPHDLAGGRYAVISEAESVTGVYTEGVFTPDAAPIPGILRDL